MNVLLQSKADLEKLFGKQATMATNLLDMVAAGEKAFEWVIGALDNGFDLTVGFFHDKARYVAFKKRSNSKWSESDVRACLMIIGDFQNWSSKPGSDFFDYIERENGKPDGKIVASATGWHSQHRRYAFVYVPVVPGDVVLAPVQDSLDKKFPS